MLICDKCNSKENSKLKYFDGLFLCPQCHLNAQNRASFDKITLFSIIDTVNLRLYDKNGGNVSRARINMIKSRCLSPHGNGEIVMKNKFGKITDKQAVNY